MSQAGVWTASTSEDDERGDKCGRGSRDEARYWWSRVLAFICVVDCAYKLYAAPPAYSLMSRKPNDRMALSRWA
jgi:hypothetical protein